jgi:hypothetical protein
MVDRRAVLVEHHGAWLTGHVLWSYDDFGRRRALVHYQTPAGLTVRELRWADELLRPPGLVLPMTSAVGVDHVLDAESGPDRDAVQDPAHSVLEPDVASDRDGWSGVGFRAG